MNALEFWDDGQREPFLFLSIHERNIPFPRNHLHSRLAYQENVGSRDGSAQRAC
jgi:hypothetical protein